MKRPAVITFMALILAVVPSAGRGNPSYFYRIVSTQATAITDFTYADGITWSNTTTPAHCAVQWSPVLGGLWLTNHFPGSTLCTTAVHRIALPEPFHTGTPSTLLYQQGQEATLSGAWPHHRIDLTRDGTEELVFDTVFLSTDDVPPSGHYAGLHLQTRTSEIILRPYTNGESITATPPSGDTWQAATGYHYLTPIACDITIHWDTETVSTYPHGPWYGVTTAYLPVRVTVNNNHHYGWVQLALDYQPIVSGTEVWWGEYRIIDCAVQALPNTPIRAGERAPE